VDHWDGYEVGDFAQRSANFINEHFAELGKDELDILKALIPVNSSNVNFYLNEEIENSINTDGIEGYLKYSLGIVFEDANGVLAVTMPSSPIFVYGISHKFLTSMEYTDYEEKSILRTISNETEVI